MDLGANEWTTFWKVTFPLILPGIMAAVCWRSACPSTTTSSPASRPGRPQTFPLFIYGLAAHRRPVQVNVIGTIIFLIAVGFVWRRTLVASPCSRPPPPDRRPATSDARTAGTASATSPAQELGGLTRSTPRLRPPPCPSSPMAGHAVVPPVWGRITNLRRRSRRGIVADHPRRRALPRLLVRDRRHEHRPRPSAGRGGRRGPGARSSCTASRTSCTTSRACGCTSGCRRSCRAARTRPSCPTPARRRSRRPSSWRGSRPAGRPSWRSATGTTAGPPRRWP